MEMGMSCDKCVCNICKVITISNFAYLYERAKEAFDNDCVLSHS